MLGSIVDSGGGHLGQLILLTDFQTDGSFLVHHFIQQGLKDGHHTMLVSMTQSLLHYSSVTSKLGTNLLKKKDEGCFIFMDGMTSLLTNVFTSSTLTTTTSTPPPTSTTNTPPPTTSRDRRLHLSLGSDSSMLDMYNSLKHLVIQGSQPSPGTHPGSQPSPGTHPGSQPSPGTPPGSQPSPGTPLGSQPSPDTHPTCLIIDGLSNLLNVGVALSEVVLFVQACSLLLTSHDGPCQGRGYLVVMVHCEEEEDMLYKHLVHLSHLHLHVQGLATGYSKEVHGEISVIWRDPACSGSLTPPPQTVQYKLTDKSVQLFARGTSKEVL